MPSPPPDNGHHAPVTARDRTSELLRFATAGSVDDGKSTLIGRLLYDSKAIFEDQLEQVSEATKRRGTGVNGNGDSEGVDLALLTDGLRAEREQGITIDVAYRYFATPRRKFIIADTPGHEQYTRNMVTGASTADLSVVLVDARNGVVEQSRRHAYISSLLRIPHMVLAVNKMDLVGWDEAVFDRVVEEFEDFASLLDITDITPIPMSALEGDNVVDRSQNMPWYQGPPLLYHLERVNIASDRNLADIRFPVQWVIRPGGSSDYRAYGGQVAGGVMRPGDDVVVLPGGKTSRIEAIELAGEEIEQAFPPMSVAVRLEDDVDVSRGDMICAAEDAPAVSRDLEAIVCWMADAPLRGRGRYVLKHTTRSARALIDEVEYRVDVNNLRHDESATELGLNDIGRVHIRTGEPIVVDRYTRNRSTGSFILIDETTNDTVGAGLICGAKR